MITEQEILDSWEVKKIAQILKRKYPFIVGIGLYHEWKEWQKSFIILVAVINREKVKEFFPTASFDLYFNVVYKDEEFHVSSLESVARHENQSVLQFDSFCRNLIGDFHENPAIPEELKLEGIKKFHYGGVKVLK
jgi:hypothetical protein